MITFSGGHRIVDVALGQEHVVLLTSDGAVLTWGQNDKGELGNGTTVAPTFTEFTHIPSLSDIAG